MNKGEIYCLTSPSNKKYIGQCVKYLSSGKKWGYLCRWKQHVIDSKNGRDNCRLLNNAIRKYNYENFQLEVLHECNIEELDHYENYYITHYNTMTPNGYNLVSGKSSSRQSEETKERRRINMYDKNVGKRYPRRDRKREEDIHLPKYLRYYSDITGKEGYRISNHPILKDRSFVSKYLSLEDKLNLALEYLNTSEADVR